MRSSIITAPREVATSGGLPRARALAKRFHDIYLIAPAFLMVLIIFAIPTTVVILQSFFDWKPAGESPFIGFANYIELFTSPAFHQILFNQAVLLSGLPLFVLAPLVVSLLLFDRVKGAGVFRTIFFFPAVLAPPIVAIMMRAVLAEDGLINSLFRAVGLDALALPWLTDETLVKPTLIVILTWAGMGVGIVIFSSALSALPVEYVEAAMLDGATWGQRMRFIVLPELRPTLELWIAFQVISVFAFSFGWIFVLTSGGPNSSSATLDFSIYQNALKFGFFGLAAAESVFLLLIVGVLGAIRGLITRREHQRESAGNDVDRLGPRRRS